MRKFLARHKRKFVFSFCVLICAVGVLAILPLFDWSGDDMRAIDDLRHGSDPFSTDTTGDGLSDAEQIETYGTDPTVDDTTGDGLSDYDEVNTYGTDPTTTDTSGDGLADYDEIYKYGTDPTTPDTSGDGLSDYDEIYEYGTDPTTPDTTGDGLSDYEQITEYGTDPTVDDTTGDGLSDYDEINQYETDPTTTDTTGDGLADYDEIYKYGTDPTTPDTSGDGLSDYDEINEYGTDPTTPDTSGDGLSDYDEIYEYGTDPTTPDTSGDGLSDYTQLYEAEFDGYDPTVNDSNGDGVPDYANYKYGAHPGTEYTVDVKEDLDARFADDMDEYISTGSEPTNYRSNLPDSVLYDEFGVLLSEDYDVVENPEVAEHFDFIHTEKPVGSTDSQSIRDVDDTGDGFSNELSESNEYLSEDKKDVLFHIETTERGSVPISALINTHLAFQDAPIDYDHSDETGVNIHFYISDEPREVGSDEVEPEFVDEVYGEFYTHGYGYHYMLFTEKDIGDRVGFAYRVDFDNYRGAVTSSDRNFNSSIGSTMMHEIGHLMSLSPEVFDGIDSHDYSYSEYPSIMNYNDGCPVSKDQCYEFSDGGEFNDWEYIAENYEDYVPDTSNL